MAKTFAYEPPLPVGSVGPRASGAWAIIFIGMSEASLFAYLFFSYYYFAIQPHSGPWPPGGPPSFLYAAPQTAAMLLGSVAAWWAQTGVARAARGALLLGLAATLVMSLAFLALQFADWFDKPFSIATDSYASLYFIITGVHLTHVVVGVVIVAAVLVWSALGYFGPVRHAPVTVAAIYWYFVTGIWLALFFTLYVTPYLT
jgi:cytochrome c oxidase subunit III